MYISFYFRSCVLRTYNYYYCYWPFIYYCYWPFNVKQYSNCKLARVFLSVSWSDLTVAWSDILDCVLIRPDCVLIRVPLYVSKAVWHNTETMYCSVIIPTFWDWALLCKGSFHKKRRREGDGNVDWDLLTVWVSSLSMTTYKIPPYVCCRLRAFIAHSCVIAQS